MKYLKPHWILVFALSLIFSCSGEEEKEIKVSDIPPAVLSAIKETLPNLKITEAEIEIENGIINYEVKGIIDSIEYEVEISPEGEILEVEKKDSKEDEE